MNTPLILGLLTAIVTIAGWFVAYLTTKWREDRTRRLEASIEHRVEQIEQFYGPLFNLVHQIFIANHVQYELLQASSVSEQDRKNIETYFQSKYFQPLHRDINDIFKNRLHLIEGVELPDSFYTYLLHAAQEDIQRTLWSDHHIDTSSVPGTPFPDEFYLDVKGSLDLVQAAYESEINSLRPAKFLFWRSRKSQINPDDDEDDDFYARDFPSLKGLTPTWPEHELEF